MAEQKPASTGSLLMSWASEACFWLAEKRRVPPLAKVIALEPCMIGGEVGWTLRGVGKAAGVEVFSWELFEVGGGVPVVDFEVVEGVDHAFLDSAGDSVVSRGGTSMVVVENNKRWWCEDVDGLRHVGVLDEGDCGGHKRSCG